jgi:ribosomal protein L11 methyltransferase
VTRDRTWPALDLTFCDALDDEARTRLLLDIDDVDALALDGIDDGARVTLYFGDAEACDAAEALLHSRGWAAAARFSRQDIADEGWAARSQADLPAVVVERLAVSPPWDVERLRGECEALAPDARPDVIVIEPSMGFGTGHHQSTRLCLRALQAVDVNGLRVLDVGTGSGVLAIAAVRRGARAALGIDPDPDAIVSATDSVARNDVSGQVALRVTGLDDPALEPADLLFANLTGVLLRREGARVQRLITPGGRAILSGFTEDEARWVADAFDACDVERRFDEDGWVALVLRRRR